MAFSSIDRACVSILIVLACCVSARSETVSATLRSGDIKLDGKLDETAWVAAPAWSGFRYLVSVPGHSEPASTAFRVLYDSDAIYLGIRCDEPTMDRLVKDAGSVYANDEVELFIDPTGQGITYAQFAVDVNNRHAYGYRLEAGYIYGPPAEPFWESAVFEGPDFWSVEVKIPLAAFLYVHSADFSDAWKLNVARSRTSARELTSWSPLEKSFHEPAHWNRVSQLPRKSDRLDVMIPQMHAQVNQATSAGYLAELRLKLSATAASAGTFGLSISMGKQLLTNKQDWTIAAGSTEAILNGLTITELGKSNLTVQLARPDGSMVMRMTYPVRFDYQAVRFRFEEPFYRQSIIPGQQLDEIRGHVALQLPAEQLAGAVARFTFAGPGLAQPLKLEQPVGNQSATFTFPVKNLAEGKATLTCAVIDAKGQALAEQATEVQKLPSPKGSCIYVDRNLNLVIQGKPLFARTYMGPNYLVSHAVQEQQPQGPPCVKIWNYPHISVEVDRMNAEDARQAVKDIEPSSRVLERTRQAALAHRDDPSMFWYSLSDEPECREISPVYLRHQYNVLRETDPYHPVMIVTREPAKFVECADILSSHPYPGPTVDKAGYRVTGDLKPSHDQMWAILKAGEGKIVPWLTPQSFSYDFINAFAVYPTFEEFRCAVFAGLVGGMKGLMPYTYGDHLRSIDLRIGNPWIYETLAELEPLLIAPRIAAPTTVESSDHAVVAWVQAAEGKTLLVAVNLTGKPVSATIHCDALGKLQQLHGYRQKTDAAVSEGTVKLEMQPYGVQLLTNPPMATDKPTGEDVNAQIRAAYDQIVARGDLLYGKRHDIVVDSSSPAWRPLASAVSLTDGNRDGLGWRQVDGPVENPWVQLSFITFTPTFSKAKIFGDQLSNLRLEVWDRGQWRVAATAGQVSGHEADFTLDAPITTVKLRLVFPDSSNEHRAELYEVELYK
ncbi:MAG: hypothetical protein IT440_05065 [Phycisphaeraceae bacterium]|nr:hypothetical protein [Phycisphaeraceae bacterium]